MIKSRKLRWAGHVARMEEGMSAFKILAGKLTGKRPLGRPRLDGRIILEWTLKKQVLIQGIGLTRLRIGIEESPCECGIETPSSISHRVVSYTYRKEDIKKV